MQADRDAEENHVSAWIVVLQLARIPVLLMLLLLTARAIEAMNWSVATMSTERYFGAWFLGALLSLVFVAVVLVGRLRRHPWAILVMEALAAGVVALIPPLVWIRYLGIDGFWVDAMMFGSAQPLGIAWLGAVGLRAFHQVRGVPEATAPLDRGASTSSPDRREQSGPD